MDYAAYFGRSPTGPNIYIATGDSGQGLTNAVAAGLVIKDMILGQDSPFAAAHDPQRTAVSALREFVSENLTAVTNLAEKMTSGDTGSVEEIEPGEGAVVRQGLSKVAVYRSESGQLHVRSATCTHAGCVVHWNSLKNVGTAPATARISLRTEPQSTGPRSNRSQRLHTRASEAAVPSLATLAAYRKKGAEEKCRGRRRLDLRGAMTPGGHKLDTASVAAAASSGMAIIRALAATSALVSIGCLAIVAAAAGKPMLKMRQQETSRSASPRRAPRNCLPCSPAS